MALLYLSVKTAESGGKERVCAIAHRWLGPPAGQLRLRVCDAAATEAQLLRGFVEGTSFWSNRWRAVPAGVGLDRQLAALWDRCLAHGLVEWGQSPLGRKPTFDLQPILMMLNADAKGEAESFRSEMPPMFRGSGLESLMRTTFPPVGPAFAQGWLGAVEDSMRREADAFLKAWQALTSEGPKWWRTTLKPLLQNDNQEATAAR